MRFNDKLSYSGQVTIWAKYDDKKVLLHEDHNIVVSGMGEILAEAMYNENPLYPYVSRFQIGTSGVSALQVSSTNELTHKLTKEEYGIEENIFFVKSVQHIGDREDPDSYFLTIDDSNRTLYAEDQVKFSLIVDKNIANDLQLNEVGLFSIGLSKEDTEICTLIAYYYFPAISKESDYSLIFEWVLTL
jgi:hypothetical protein